MFAPILKHINQGVPNLSGCREPAGVVAVPPHSPATAERTVHRLRHPDREPLDTAPKTAGAVCLDDEVQVVGLDAEVQQPEGVGGGGAQRGAHSREDLILTERR